MIPACFPQDMTLAGSNGHKVALKGYRPVVGQVLDLDRVYLLLMETMVAVGNDCIRNGFEQPVQLVPEIITNMPAGPMLLKDFCKRPVVKNQGLVRVCLVNGGGGGLGDGIMFSPALEVLRERLAELVPGHRIELDVYSVMADRTSVVLHGVPQVRVFYMPFTLQQFSVYDVYVDFSGMMAEKSFNTMHMTDFVLARMGIDSQGVKDSLKEPCLRLEEPAPPEVTGMLAAARQKAGPQPLVAVIFTATRTRTMPEGLAADIIRELAVQFQPVIIMQSDLDSKGFIRQYGLQDTVIDLSEVSSSFRHYIALLAGVDGIISVDTSAVHIGGALRKPTVGIFNSIPQQLRVLYSPTVRPIQLSYQGRSCRAPCGASKNRFFLNSRLADGRRLQWAFGYACEESFDRQAMIEWIDGQLRELDFEGDINQQLEEIRMAASLKFTRDSAPCWNSLKPDMAVKALAEAMKEIG